MNNEGQFSSESKQIQGLLDRCLRSDPFIRSRDSDANHLDEDSLTVFVEGELNENEAGPIISHLAGCSYCRHISAELVKLDLALADDPSPLIRSEREPTKVADVLNGVLERIFGSAEGAVFAHQENDDEEEKDDVERSSE